jgi:hypothetical protein
MDQFIVPAAASAAATQTPWLLEVENLHTSIS